MSRIAIKSMASVSPLGEEQQTIWVRYLDEQHALSLKSFPKFNVIVGGLSDEILEELEKLRLSDNKYKSLDKTALLSIYTARRAFQKAGWKEETIGINIGSSRGATDLFEKYHRDFLDNTVGKTATLTSPTTTLGNIASWVAHDLQVDGPAISHSIACSTALHSVLNGVAWLRSGMSTRFIVGAAEAANTAFTVAQMKALKIYTDLEEEDFPSRALDLQKTRNTMCLGEGAAVFCLESGEYQDAIAYIEGVGYATEKLKHNISITDDAQCFQKSMKMALDDAGVKTVDAIVMHAPGTIKGDSSELKAIEQVFGKETMPLMTSNKWKIGHTLAASGALSMELAILMLQHQTFIGVPYTKIKTQKFDLDRVMVNAVGFGGNAVSIVLGINEKN